MSSRDGWFGGKQIGMASAAFFAASSPKTAGFGVPSSVPVSSTRRDVSVETLLKAYPVTPTMSA